MPNPSTAAELERTDHHLRVRLRGELDQDTVPELAHAILSGIEPDDRAVTLDLDEVTLCDSVGIAMFVTTQQHAAKHGIQLVLHNPSPILRATFAVCGVNELLPIATDD